MKITATMNLSDLAERMGDATEADAERMRDLLVERYGTTDRAAYGGIGIRRTARQQRRDWAALDRSIERVVRLQNRRVAVVAKLHRAEAREAS